MPIKYIPYQSEPLRGQAVLPFLRYKNQFTAKDFTAKGLPYFETELVEKVGKEKNQNLLIHGDCLNACAYLKEQGIKVDLVYIDPPFASGANYAKRIYLRRNPKLVRKLEEAEEKMKKQVIEGAEIDNSELQAIEETMYGDIWQKEDYLNWMYERLLAIKEVMSDTASIYVHLDWHIGHYMKVLMDEIFGEENFINEVIWGYSTQGRPDDKFARKHDTIFIYVKDNNHYIFNIEGAKIPYSEKYIKSHFRDTDDKGNICRIRIEAGKKRIYYPSMGMIPNDVWTDIYYENPMSSVRTDYSTQKPRQLLERIINSSSNKDMIVADFFGGSGVAAISAHNLGRKFITCDIGINAIQTSRDELANAGASFDVFKIQDGIDLFRNPAQTMEKLPSLIGGLTTEHDFGDFWFGALQVDGKICPCHMPDLLDKSKAILNPSLFSMILDAAASLENVAKVVVCAVDIEGREEIERMIKERELADIGTGKLIEFIFKDLKELSDLMNYPDEVACSVSEKEGKYEIVFEKLISDNLIRKINEYNAKKAGKQTSMEEEGGGAKPGPKIEISEDGLELIEYVSADSTNRSGAWKSDSEIKIDKKGFMIINGEKTKDFWDGKLVCGKKPLRVKVRNIAGDETIVNIS